MSNDKTLQLLSPKQIGFMDGRLVAICYNNNEEANAHELVRRWNAFEELLAACKAALEGMDKPAVQASGEWQTGMFCGLEDRDITDRYEACMYGYEQALGKVQEWVLCDLEAAIAEAKYEKG